MKQGAFTLIFTIILVLVGVILLLVIGFLWLRKWIQKPDPEYVLNFIAKNPNRSSLTIVKNGKLHINYQGQQLRPLASTVKIILAIEFAQQAATKDIDPSELIDVKDLNRFYIPGTDGGAHQEWLHSLDLLTEGKVPLSEVANGMIAFSSNANTEYLMWRLGLERINSNLEKLQLSMHEEIFPIVSYLLIPYEVAKAHHLDIFDRNQAKKVLNLVKEMSKEAYKNEANRIHAILSQDSDGKYKEQANLAAWHNLGFDQIASRKLVRATTSEYVSIVQKINNTSFFSQEVIDQLQAIMEWPMKNSSNQDRFLHLGGKGGSTAEIVTFALFAEDKQGNKTEIAVFFEDVHGYETVKLSTSLSDFQLAILTNYTEWHEKIASALKGNN